MNTSTVILKDQTNLVKYEWLSDRPQAHLLLVHGYAEHAQRYDHFGRFLNDRDISLTSYDQRGHGRSDGLQAYIDRFHRYVSDLVEIQQDMDGPIFLMGHSLGGLVAVQYILTQDHSQISGLISSSAALEIDPNLSPFLQKLAPLLGMIFPKLPTEKLDKTYLTRDPKILEAYLSDPLIYLKGTRARTGAEMLKAIKENRTRFTDIDLPLLVLHGDADRLTMPGGSQKLYDDAISTDKTLKLYPDLYHELVNEPEKEKIMTDIAKWILERTN